jgi:hypothetical protein
MTDSLKFNQEVVGIDEHGGIVTLDSLFGHGQDFKGATGSVFDVHSREYLDTVTLDDFVEWVDDAKKVSECEGLE